MKRSRPAQKKTKKPKALPKKRGPYKKGNQPLKKTWEVRVDIFAFDFIKSVTRLLGLETQSQFLRLAVSRALDDLPELIGRTADSIATKHIKREVARKLGCAETVIDWGEKKTSNVLESLAWTPKDKRTIDGVVEVIPRKREGRPLRSESPFAGTFPARTLSPKESLKIFDYLGSTESARDRVLLAKELRELMNELIDTSFDRRKRLFLSVADLRGLARAVGFNGSEIDPAHWNDPEVLQLLVDSKSQENWDAADQLAAPVSKSRKSDD